MSEVHLPHPLPPLSLPLSPQEPSSQSRPNPSTRQKKAGTRARVSTAGLRGKKEPRGQRPFRRRYWGWYLGWCPGPPSSPRPFKSEV